MLGQAQRQRPRLLVGAADDVDRPAQRLARRSGHTARERVRREIAPVFGAPWLGPVRGRQPQLRRQRDLHDEEGRPGRTQDTWRGPIHPHAGHGGGHRPEREGGEPLQLQVGAEGQAQQRHHQRGRHAPEQQKAPRFVAGVWPARGCASALAPPRGAQHQPRQDGAVEEPIGEPEQGVAQARRPAQAHAQRGVLGVVQRREIVLPEPEHVWQKDQRCHAGTQPQPDAVHRVAPAAQMQPPQQHAGTGHGRLVFGQHAQARAQAQQCPGGQARALRQSPARPGHADDARHHHDVVVEVVQPPVVEGHAQACEQRHVRKRRAAALAQELPEHQQRRQRAGRAQHVGGPRSVPAQRRRARRQPRGQRRVLVVAPLHRTQPDGLLDVVQRWRDRGRAQQRQPGGAEDERQRQRREQG